MRRRRLISLHPQSVPRAAAPPHTHLNLIGVNQAEQRNENVVSLEFTVCAIWKPANLIAPLTPGLRIAMQIIALNAP